jgi:hypothetical protein
MKRAILFAFISVITMHVTIAQQNIRDQFLVDHISRIQNPPGFYLTEFVYDADSMLIKMITTERYRDNWGWSDVQYLYKFEYDNKKVSKITQYESQFLYRSIFFFYNTEGLLIKEESKDIFGNINDRKQIYYKNGTVDSIYCFEGFIGQNLLQMWRTIIPIYDETYNVVKAIVTYPKICTGGGSAWYCDTIVCEQFYEYDEQLQPPFRMDYLFAFQPLPGLENLFTYERLLSVNNMTKASTCFDSTTYKYTYYEHGLPETYQRIRNGSQSTFRIYYKPIETSVLKPAQEITEIKVYPNPTSGELTITNYKSQITDIAIFDIYGREIQISNLKSQISNPQINISHLASGIYFVKITTEAGEVVKKVVKQPVAGW